MKAFSALSPAELAALRTLVRAHPVFRVYVAAAEAATAAGATDRSVLLAADGAGATLGIAFEQMEVRTIVGRLSAAEETIAAALPQAGELHVDAETAARLGGRLGRRVIASDELHYYVLNGRPLDAPDPRCAPLGPGDLAEVAAFFGAHYPQHIFSPWMLDNLFLGIFEKGRLVACGGVVAGADGVANVGNFLTAPDARGRGLCRAVAATLTHALFDRGFSQITLGTTKDNDAARRAYEATGFRCFDRRIQLELSP